MELTVMVPILLTAGLKYQAIGDAGINTISIPGEIGAKEI